TGAYPRENVLRLCDIALHPDPAIARAGASGLFTHLIEVINDSFQPGPCMLYDRVFADVIECYRRTPGAITFDRRLREAGLHNAETVLARGQKLAGRDLNPALLFATPPEKIALLSRVTLGADVAITSVIMQGLRQAFPAAEFVLIGSEKLRELYGGAPRIRMRALGYNRGGTLAGRLETWHDVAAIVAEEYQTTAPGAFCLIDPDSRLTQLGLLPVLPPGAAPGNDCFFPSRAYQQPGLSAIGALAGHWTQTWAALAAPPMPFLALPPEHLVRGREITGKLRAGQDRPLISLSFGVGGNPRKRIADPFEQNLARELARHATLVIDKGAGADDAQRADTLVSSLRADGRTVIEIDAENAGAWQARERIRADVITWQGGIGAFAGLIAACDEYIGYDSSGQHIAAALGTPLTTIFVNSGSGLFAERWRPYGPGDIKTLLVSPDDVAVFNTTAQRVMDQTLEIHRARGR
ncbi:MAG: glycosyltransferase family 9 protein, partial [Blastocatellia bacterium]